LSHKRLSGEAFSVEMDNEVEVEGKVGTAVEGHHVLGGEVRVERLHHDEGLALGFLVDEVGQVLQNILHLHNQLLVKDLERDSHKCQTVTDFLPR